LSSTTTFSTEGGSAETRMGEKRGRPKSFENVNSIDATMEFGKGRTGKTSSTETSTQTFDAGYDYYDYSEESKSESIDYGDSPAAGDTDYSDDASANTDYASSADDTDASDSASDTDYVSSADDDISDSDYVSDVADYMDDASLAMAVSDYDDVEGPAASETRPGGNGMVFFPALHTNNKQAETTSFGVNMLPETLVADVSDATSAEETAEPAESPEMSDEVEANANATTLDQPADEFDCVAAADMLPFYSELRTAIPALDTC